MLALAERHDPMVISDELYADLTFAPRTHLPFASLDPTIADLTVTISAASMSFSLAGLRCVVGHIGVAALGQKLAEQPPGPSVNVLGMRASLAAWTEAAGWLASVLDYLDVNRRVVAETRRRATARGPPPHAGGDVPGLARLPGTWARPGSRGILPRARAGRPQLRRQLQPRRDGFLRLNFTTSMPVLHEIVDRLADSVAAVRRLTMREQATASSMTFRLA